MTQAVLRERDLAEHATRCQCTRSAARRSTNSKKDCLWPKAIPGCASRTGSVVTPIDGSARSATKPVASPLSASNRARLVTPTVRHRETNLTRDGESHGRAIVLVPSVEWVQATDVRLTFNIETKKVESSMRKLIAGMKTSIDSKIEGPDGFADWVDAWSEDYGLSSQIDACLLGGTMYTGYEQYWSAIQNHEPGKPLPMTGKLPIPAEVDWARFAAKTPHYVLSNTLKSARWASTRIIRSVEDVAALKKQPGKDIYLMGGARITSSLFDAGLVDEIRLLVYPLLAGKGKALFSTSEKRHKLKLADVKQQKDGLVSLVYEVAS
jgi:dihydrofolate reductase